MTGMSRDYLIEEYVHKGRSFADIAGEFGTYPNKIRREAIRFGISPRDKSSAQKKALKSGRHKHPTKGKKRSNETKIKISDSVSDSWKALSEKEYNKRVSQAKDRWDKMPKEDKESLMRSASEGVRRAGKEGSKMEKFLAERLRESGYVVQFHRKGLIPNEKLEVDLFLPELKTAIEIDGPAHFFPIWGEESLARNLRSDAQKTGLLITAGFAILRVKHLTKHISGKHMRDLSNMIMVELKQIELGFPPEDKRLIEVEI